MINRRGFMKLVAGCASAIGLDVPLMGGKAAFRNGEVKLVNEQKPIGLNRRVPFYDDAAGHTRHLRYQNGLCCGVED